MRILRKADNIFDTIINAFAACAGVIMVGSMLIVVYDVIMRYFFTRPTDWAFEYSEFSLLFITFLGATWVLRKDGHVVIDILFNRFNPKTQKTINIITSILAAIVFFMLTWYGAKATWNCFIAGAARPGVVQTPTYLVVFIIPVGSFLFAIESLKRAYLYQKERIFSIERRYGID